MNNNFTARFQGAPAFPSHHPAPTAPQLPAPPLPPFVPAPLPLLTVRPNGDVTLTKPLMQAVPHLRAGAPVDVVPPGQHGRGGAWHLDTRPTAPRRLPPTGVMRFRALAPSSTHFIIPAMPAAPGHKGGARGTAGRRAVLCFALGPEELEQVCLTDENGRQVCAWRGTGYYELLPLR